MKINGEKNIKTKELLQNKYIENCKWWKIKWWWSDENEKIEWGGKSDVILRWKCFVQLMYFFLLMMEIFYTHAINEAMFN